MENGLKQEMGKNGKPIRRLKKWPENGLLREFSIFFSIFGPIFGHALSLASWGLFSIWFSIISPLPAFGRFGAMQARHDPILPLH